jgi:hypothetical protein
MAQLRKHRTLYVDKVYTYVVVRIVLSLWVAFKLLVQSLNFLPVSVCFL